MSFSRGLWIVRHHPRNRDEFFVQAPRNNPSDPYDIQVLGEDTGHLYPVEQRLADAHLVSAAPEMFFGLIRANRIIDAIFPYVGKMALSADTLADMNIHSLRYAPLMNKASNGSKLSGFKE